MGDWALVTNAAARSPISGLTTPSEIVL